MEKKCDTSLTMTKLRGAMSIHASKINSDSDLLVYLNNFIYYSHDPAYYHVIVRQSGFATEESKNTLINLLLKEEEILAIDRIINDNETEYDGLKENGILSDHMLYGYTKRGKK